MTGLTEVPQPAIQKNADGGDGPQLTGIWQRVTIARWFVLLLLSLLSFVLSITALNIWDRVPAINLPGYFPNMNQEVLTSRADFQNEVLGLGFSLSSFAFLLTAFRLMGSLSLFILSVLILRRYSGQLMAVLFAILLAIMGGAGIWDDTLFGWAGSLVPWMKIPGQALGLLLWFALIVLYAFPDGHFTPRWTLWLALLLIPLSVSLIFDLPIFLNPGTWPGLLALLPNVVFIGAGFFSVCYRYAHMTDPLRKARYLPFMLAVSLLMVLYFIQFALNDVYGTLAGQPLFQTMRGLVIYILISEPLWFAAELVFTLLVARSIFNQR